MIEDVACHVASFKAKYGVSNQMLARLVHENASDIAKQMASNTFPSETIDLCNKLSEICERIVSEGEMLQDHAPYIEILKHENEAFIKQQDKMEQRISSLEYKYLNMTLWSRIKYVFKL